MSDDLVKRLRKHLPGAGSALPHVRLQLEAADEIERLQTSGKALVVERDLWQQRAEAAEALLPAKPSPPGRRRAVGKMTPHDFQDFITTPEIIKEAGLPKGALLLAIVGPQQWKEFVRCCEQAAIRAHSEKEGDEG